MKQALRILAVTLAAVGLAGWLATGAHRGWTQTSSPRKVVDEVTGIEGVTYERRLTVGVDLLAVAGSCAVVLAGVSFLVGHKPTKPSPSTP
jgi:hypothetical protein